MIAVIADDLTGAAEIGGIALRHGLSVVMDTKVHDHADVEVLVIATDTRSKSAVEANRLVKEVTSQLLKLKPEFIFKKTDSLLRGHVGGELLEQLAASGKKRVLLIPANPVLKRTIDNGIYYSDNIPLNESNLANASRNKIHNSGVLHLIGEKFKEKTQVVSLCDSLPDSGMIIGNTLTEFDLDGWVQKLDSDTIPAGSGGFFNAILKDRIKGKNIGLQDQLVVGKKIIYVCGSAFPLSKASVSVARAQGQYVSYMPEIIFCPDYNQSSLLHSWVSDILNGLEEKCKVIIAVDQLQCNNGTDHSNDIRYLMAVVIEKVMEQVEVNELVIEGGATASSIIEKLGYERFFPSQELAQGVIRMKVQEAKDLFLTMKPGSYQWPSSIWKTI